MGDVTRDTPPPRGEPQRRRRRHRHGSAEGQGPGAEPVAETSPVHDPEPDTPVEAPPVPGRGRPPRNGNGTGSNGGFNGGAAEDRETERGLRGLVGSGSSQVGVRAAMRARDAARPTDADIADAEATLHIVRRGWVPRDELPRGGR